MKSILAFLLSSFLLNLSYSCYCLSAILYLLFILRTILALARSFSMSGPEKACRWFLLWSHMSRSKVRSGRICFWMVRGVFSLSRGGGTTLIKSGKKLLGVHLNLHLGIYLSCFWVEPCPLLTEGDKSNPTSEIVFDWFRRSSALRCLG